MKIEKPATKHQVLDMVVSTYIMQQGDFLGMHDHPEGMEHSTIVVKGSVMCEGEMGVQHLDDRPPYNVIYWPPNKDHNVIAGPLGAIVVNISKEGGMYAHITKHNPT